MKSQILKIAGVKDEASFYAKFPSEEAFMKKHGKEFQAKYGANIKKAQDGRNLLELDPTMPMSNYQENPYAQTLGLQMKGFQGLPAQSIGIPKMKGVQDVYDTSLSTELSQQTPSFASINKPQFSDIVGKAMPAVGDIVSGFSQLGGARKKMLKSKQASQVSDVVAQASATRDEIMPNRYNLPTDSINTGEEFFPIQGVGTNPLAKYGTNLPKAANGFSNFMTQGGGGQAISGLTGNLFGNSGGSQIGGGVGELAGTAFGGPLGGALGKIGGQIVGGLLDTNAKKTKQYDARTERNNNIALANNYAQAMQGQYGSYMEDGGQLSEDINVIDNDHLETISYNPFLPDGGETVMFRGPSHKNGGIPISYGNNPVEVEGGEPAVKLENGGQGEELTVFGNLQIPQSFAESVDSKAKGKKFKNYVNDLAKVENKQNKILEKSSEELQMLNPKNPFEQLKSKSLEAMTIGANMKLKQIADKKTELASLQTAINETAKQYGLNAGMLSKGKIKKEKNPELYAEYGTDIEYGEDGINVDPDKKKLTRAQAKEQGYKQNSKGEWVRLKKEGNTTKEEKVEIVKSAKALDAIPKGQKLNSETGLYGGVTQEQFDAYKKENNFFDWTNFDPKKAEDLNRWKQAFNTEAEKRGSKARILDDKNNTPKFGQQYLSAKLDDEKKIIPSEIANQPEYENVDVYDPELAPIPYKRSWAMDAYNQILPWIRPSDARGLDPNQLYPEMLAMANNQLEGVQAQSFQPQLDVPYDISLQDQLNEINAQTRGVQRMLKYNPAAQANLVAQNYQASSKVLGDQFRQNQGMKNQVYSNNRNIMNDAQLKNLGIFDQQYQRQAQARSNTKETAQEIANSMSSKYLQNDLENNKLRTMENMYNYRFGDDFRARNLNPLFQPNMTPVGAQERQQQIPVLDSEGNVKYYQLAPTKQNPSLANTPIVAKNETKIKLTNGAIMKTLKRI